MQGKVGLGQGRRKKKKFGPWIALHFVPSLKCSSCNLLQTEVYILICYLNTDVSLSETLNAGKVPLTPECQNHLRSLHKIRWKDPKYPSNTNEKEKQSQNDTKTKRQQNPFTTSSNQSLLVQLNKSLCSRFKD